MKSTRHLFTLIAGCGMLVIIGLFSGGCAIGTTQLVMSHGQLATIPQTRQGDIVVRPFVDKRQHTQYIGNKRNGFGMVLGHVGTQPGVRIDELLTQYFIEALKQAGYNARLEQAVAAGAAAPQQKCDAIVEGEIITFWMDLYMMVWHQVGVNVKAINPANQQVVWERLIQGSEKRTLWVGATGEFERIVREAMTKALDRAAIEFASDDFYNKAIKKQP